MTRLGIWSMFIAVIAVYTIAESSSAPLNDADFFTVTFFPLAEFKGARFNVACQKNKLETKSQCCPPGPHDFMSAESLNSSEYEVSIVFFKGIECRGYNETRRLPMKSEAIGKNSEFNSFKIVATPKSTS